MTSDTTPTTPTTVTIDLEAGQAKAQAPASPQAGEPADATAPRSEHCRLFVLVAVAMGFCIGVGLLASLPATPVGASGTGAPAATTQQIGEKSYLDFLQKQNMAGNIVPTSVSMPGQTLENVTPAPKPKKVTPAPKPETGKKGQWCTWDDDCESGTCIHDWASGSGRQYCQ